jgi:hypothetical protein
VGVCWWPEPRSEVQAKTPASDATPGGGAAETQQPEGEVRELQADRPRVHQCMQVYYGCWQDNMMAGHGARRRLHALQLKSGSNPQAAGVLTWFEGDVYLGQFQKGEFYGCAPPLVTDVLLLELQSRVS